MDGKVIGAMVDRLAHAVDEYVPLAEVVAVTKTIALTIVDWYGGALTE